MRVMGVLVLTSVMLVSGCSINQVESVRQIDHPSAEGIRKIETFANTVEYSEALTAVVAFAEADYGRVLWCDCVDYYRATRHEPIDPEVFLFRVFVCNDGTFVESVPEMTTVIGWLPSHQKVHGYYTDIFPHPCSEVIEPRELLSDAAKARIRKRDRESILR